jgi:S-adenosyl methyltransferase
MTVPSLLRRNRQAAPGRAGAVLLDEDDPRSVPRGVDPSVPNVARMYNYYLGGKDNFVVDRDLAERVLREAPAVARMVRVNRGFLHRTARFLAERRGIRQFIDIGCGLPTEINLDDTVRRFDPGGRVAYVDDDAMVLSHARAVMAVRGRVGVIEADLRDPPALLGHPELTRLIDFDQPVAVYLLNVLHFIPDDPGRIVDELVCDLPSGSHIVLSHAERTPDLMAAATLYEETDLPFRPRGRREITGLVDGLHPVAPYPARLPLSHSGRAPEAGDAVPLIGCVARKH